MTHADDHLGLAREAERNRAFMSGVLHLFAAIAVGLLLWDLDVASRAAILVFSGVEVVLAGLALAGAAGVTRRGRFRRLSGVESLGAALNFAALAWLGPDMASESPSKYLLMIALVALTSVAAANSSLLERRRVWYLRSLVMVGTSYFAAFAASGEFLFAVFTVLWSLSIATFSRAGHLAMRELEAQRRASDETARHDDLTGLLNRSAFMTDLERVRSAREPTALVLLDLDGFKAINDGFGHPAGDAALRTVAARLGAMLPVGTSLCRLGSDEFAALVSTADVDLVRTVERLLERVGEPIGVDGRDLYVAASVGWTEVSSGTDPAVLLAEADAALRRSKTSATRTWTGFDPAMRAELDRSLELRQRFRDVVKQRRIDFRAQPIVRTADRYPVAVELLARWPRDDEVEIGTDEFNRLADETGLAVELDRLALDAAAGLLDAWRDDPVLAHVVIKANISPIHLHNLVLARTLRDLVPDTDRSRLGLEFVEARLMDAGRRHHELLRELAGTGVTLSIDDFGTGYSSLAYLRTLPVSEIKLDRSFITGIDRDPVSQGLVQAIVDLATTLGLATVAEGVENDAELATVAELGAEAVQGYAIARPRGLGEIANFLRERCRETAPPR